MIQPPANLLPSATSKLMTGQIAVDSHDGIHVWNGHEWVGVSIHRLAALINASLDEHSPESPRRNGMAENIFLGRRRPH